MARHSIGALAAGAGSTALPSLSLYAAAAASGTLRECGITNTTATAVAYKLARLTTAGTQGAGLTETQHDPDRPVSQCQAFQTHTAGPTIGGDLGYRAALGAAVGSGVIWTFGDTGIRFPVAVTNGIGVVTENGTGQISQIYLVWDE